MPPPRKRISLYSTGIVFMRCKVYLDVGDRPDPQRVIDRFQKFMHKLMGEKHDTAETHENE